MFGVHCIKCWSRTQATVAHLSAEADLYAAGKAATEALGTQSFLRDLGADKEVRVHIDSSAALSLVSKAGLGQIVSPYPINPAAFTARVVPPFAMIRETDLRRTIPVYQARGVPGILPLAQSFPRLLTR